MRYDVTVHVKKNNKLRNQMQNIGAKLKEDLCMNQISNVKIAKTPHCILIFNVTKSLKNPLLPILGINVDPPAERLIVVGHSQPITLIIFTRFKDSC